MKQFNPNTNKWEVLVDKRNFTDEIPKLLAFYTGPLSSPLLTGFDIETEDSKRHQGLNQFMALDAESTDYKKSKKLVFDLRRTVITGFSIHPDNSDSVWYFNTGHADAENRLDKADMTKVLEYIKSRCVWVIHNAAFELAQLGSSWGLDLGKNYICTLQMCVSAYNDDQYDPQKFANADLGGMTALIPAIAKSFAGYVPRSPLSADQQELIKQVSGKDSKAAFSYNSYARSLAYGYGLKKAVKSWFGYSQESFEAVLNGKAHMGLLTGEQVLHYGADDAYWCLQLMKRVLQFMNETNPAVVKTFFEQENPMPHIFAEVWRRGIRLNYDNIHKRTAEARGQYAGVIRDLVKALQHFRFEDAPNARLIEKQAKWYVGYKKDKKSGEMVPQNNYIKYRGRIQTLMDLKVDELSDYELVKALSGSVTDNWMAEHKEKPDKDQLNIVHYMSSRVLYHDLMNISLVYVKGQIQSGSEARGKLKEFITEMSTSTTRWLKEISRYKIPVPAEFASTEAYAEHLRATYPAKAANEVMACLDKLSGIEQAVKLYLTPYLMLVDPETHRIYPTISSMLNTRRMASENPNTMQLAKRSEATYVRGFFLPERDDHVYVCVDWSQVELVLIGEESKDPGFKMAFGQIPYSDLHLGAATSAMQVYYPAFSEKDLKDLRTDNTLRLEELQLNYPIAFTNPVKGIPLDGKKAYKFWRGEAGKPSNFGYWYSGSLMTVQGKLGWTDKQMWSATENYRKKFPIAENWRCNTIEELKGQGYVDVFDGHRRYRYEATDWWKQQWMAKWAAYGNPALTAFADIVANKLARRAGNQGVNAKIQGGCAPLAKRSIRRLVEIIERENLDAYFVMPIHDELVFSVHKDIAVEFGYRIREVMCNHPDLVQWLKLDGTISVGRTLEPYHKEKAPDGQIELDEAPIIAGYVPEEYEGQSLPPELRQRVVDYLFERAA